MFRSELLDDLLLGLSESESPRRSRSERSVVERKFCYPARLGQTYSGWAKKLDNKMLWWFPILFWVSTGAKKSLHGEVDNQISPCPYEYES